MRPDWESGLRGRIYAFGRRLTPLALRRALRRHVRPERLLGLRKPPVELARFDFDPGRARPGAPTSSCCRSSPGPIGDSGRSSWPRPSRGAERGSSTGRSAAPTSRGSRRAWRRESCCCRSKASAGRIPPTAGCRTPRSRPRSTASPPRALRFDLQDVVLLVESPFWAPLAAALRERFGWRIVYDCLDAHEAFSTNRAGILADPERALAANADLVVATSETLRLRMAAWNPDARLLPNACDFALFAAIPDPDPGARGGRLTVGYAGAVDEWFDMALLAELGRAAAVVVVRDRGRPRRRGARAHPAPAQPRLPRRAARTGEMPGFRARFDVEIIPFRLSALTHATDPVKLYEAAAAGRTVVATPMALARAVRAPRRRAPRRDGPGVRAQIEAAAAEGAAGAAAPARLRAGEHVGHPRRGARRHG